MSYEGWEQHVCANGHQFPVVDIFTMENDPQKCPICGANSVWHHCVDETNGYEPMNPSTYPVDLVEKTPVETAVCNLGHSHVIKHPTFHIPEKE